MVLAQCDELQKAEQVLADVTMQARDFGHVLATATASSIRALVLYESGQLAAAEVEARNVLGKHDDRSLPVISVPVAAAALVHILIETDRAQPAEDLLRRLGLTARVPASGFYLPLRSARGRLMIALGRLDEGIRELTDCYRFAMDNGWQNPATAIGSISDLTHALARNGSAEAGREFASSELSRARHFGANRQTAIALCAHGLLVGGRAGLAELEEAAALMSRSPGELERVRTIVALGSAQRRLGQRAAARRRLLSGMELAQRCGAATLEKVARAELRLAGGRIRGAHRAVGTALTPAEQRVALMASTGLSNREIARSLYI